MCDPQKEPDPGAGPATGYTGQFPMATLRAGQNVRWRWPAKNHANTGNAGNVEVYISATPNAGDVFPPSSGNPYAVMSYSSDNGDCLGLGESTDKADCQGVWQLGRDLAPGRYTIMWWWEFNPNEARERCSRPPTLPTTFPPLSASVPSPLARRVARWFAAMRFAPRSCTRARLPQFYNSCADVNIVAAAEGGEEAPEGPGGGQTDGSTPGAGSPAASPPPPPQSLPSQVVFLVTLAGAVDFAAVAQANFQRRLAGALFGVAPDDITLQTTSEAPVRVSVAVAAPSTDAARALAQEISAFPRAYLSMELNVEIAAVGEPSIQQVGGGGRDEQTEGGLTASTAVLGLLFVAACAALVFFVHRHRAERGAPPPSKAGVEAHAVHVTSATATPTFAVSLQQQAEAPLPDGWTSAVDPTSGVVYYVNTATGTSSWTHPRVSNRGAPPPPPPPADSKV